MTLPFNGLRYIGITNKHFNHIKMFYFYLIKNGILAIIKERKNKYYAQLNLLKQNKK